MHAVKGIEPITELKTRCAELIRRVRVAHQPLIITQNGKPAAVLQDVESYQQERDALMLLKFIAQGVEDAKAGRTAPHDRVKKRFNAKLREMLAHAHAI